MAIYSLANRTTNVTSGQAAFELRTGGTLRAKVLEVDIFLAATTASTYGLGRPQAIGGTPTTPVQVLAEDAADPAGSAQTALAWSVGPTIPSQFFRRISLPATVGTGVIWTFPRGLVIPSSNSIVLWNLASNGAVDINVVEDE
jgi:hypothetical protein